MKRLAINISFLLSDIPARHAVRRQNRNALRLGSLAQTADGFGTGLTAMPMALFMQPEYQRGLLSMV